MALSSLVCTLILMQPTTVPSGATFYSIVPETEPVSLKMTLDLSRPTPYGFSIDTLVKDKDFPQYQIVKTPVDADPAFTVTMGATTESEGEVSLPGISMGYTKATDSKFVGGWRLIGERFGMDGSVVLPDGDLGQVVMTCQKKK